VELSLEEDLPTAVYDPKAFIPHTPGIHSFRSIPGAGALPHGAAVAAELPA
jgi:hypothetical protein